MSQKSDFLNIIMATLAVAITVVTIVFSLFKTLEFNNTIGFDIINIMNMLFSLIVMIIFIIYYIYGRYLESTKLPISHTVAIVGFPRSGKTTMIISIFGEIFAGRILSIHATPKGTTSIERINESLERLQRGQALGPTLDQDRFAFRADVTVKGRFLPRKYKVEFGDFPGEYSETISNSKSWLHTTEFFKWVVDCDAIIFFIDLGLYLVNGENYIAEMSSAVRAAWQHFASFNTDRNRDLKNMPIVLVFTKADLFGVNKNPEDIDIFEEEVMKLGFGKDKIPPVTEINHAALDLGKSKVMSDFGELIRYFEKESSNFRVLFISCFGLYNGKRLGISELLEAVLP